MPRSRAPIIAVAAAGLALAVAVVAVVIVVTRAPAAPRGLAVDDGEISAADVVALRDAKLEPVRGGVGLAAGNTLGLHAGDKLISIDGVPVGDQADLAAALSTLAVEGSATTLYVEVDRGGTPIVVRRAITGTLQDAWIAAHPQPVPVPKPVVPTDPFADPSLVAPTIPQPADPAPVDDLQAAIESGITKVDDTHFKVDKDLVDKLFDNPMGIAKGARVVPAVKNGKPDGFKLYAIRPNSVYAKLGLNNGDTVQRINGHEMTSADKALEVYTQLKDAKKLVIEGVRRGKPFTLHYTIK